MRFRQLCSSVRDTVAVYRSSIHGLGLYARRDIGAGEMVIEYAGEVIRAVLTDKREQMYERTRPTGDPGCYMFRLSETKVVDATVAPSQADNIAVNLLQLSSNFLTRNKNLLN